MNKGLLNLTNLSSDYLAVFTNHIKIALSGHNLTMIKIIILFLSFNLCDLEVNGQSVKIWSTDLNMIENNQKLFQKACSKDRIIFPNGSLIFLNTNVNSNKIILPYNGMIVFGNKTQFFSSKAKKCFKGQDLLYEVKPGHWFDPKNWNQTLNNEIISGQSPYNPIPHSDRIPCSLDDVVFPNSMSFKVNLDLIDDYPIQSLTINDQKMNDDEFSQFIHSFVGNLIFKTDYEYKLIIGNQVSLSEVCENGQPCPCLNQDLDILNKICSYVRTCPELECYDPVHPIGHCCPICGALVSIELDSDLNFQLLKNFFESYWTKLEYQRSLGYISQISYSHVQAVITDKGDQKGVAKRCAKAFSEYLNEDKNQEQPNIFNVRLVRVEISDDWIADSWSGSTFLVLFLLLITVFLIYAIYYLAQEDRFQTLLRHQFLLNFRSRLTNSQFAFVRFHNSENGDRVEIETTSPIEETAKQRSPVCSKSQDIQLCAIPKESGTSYTGSFEMKSQAKHDDTEQIDLKPLSDTDKSGLLDMITLEDEE